MAGRPRIELSDGRLHLAWDGVAAWDGLAALARLRGPGVAVAEHRTSRWRARPTGGFEAALGPLDARLDIDDGPTPGSLAITLSMRAVDGVDLAEAGLAGEPRGPGGSAPGWALTSGFQSWDSSGCVPIGGADSWWSLAVAGQAPAGLAMAGETARRSSLRFRADPGSVTAAWCEPDRFRSAQLLARLSASEVWTSEALLVAGGSDVVSALAGLAVGATARAAEPPPRGWLSWYHFGPWIGVDDIVSNAEMCSSGAFEGLGLDHVQVDDGWQRSYGDWYSRPAFEGGLRGLAARLSGRVLGLWTAPFLVSAGSDLADSAPAEWFLPDPAGGRGIDPVHTVFGPMHVLDLRRPEVLEHLRETFARLRAEGVDYFKIDFLYAGAYSGTAALRAGLEAIRAGVGDAYVLGCGAPLLPVVGIVDGCRIGPDTAYPTWNAALGGPRPDFPGDEVRAVLLNVAARAMLRGWFQTDPDVALVGGGLELEQGRQLVTAAALGGGPYFLSDDLRALAPERLALLNNPEVTGLADGSPAIADWEPSESGNPPSRWRRGRVLAVFNHGPTPVDVDPGIPTGREVRDLWARRELGPWPQSGTVTVPARGVRLLRVEAG